MNLYPYTKNPFKRRSLGLQRLMNYGAVQLDRFTADNVGGMWTARITATGVALSGLDTGMFDNETKLAIQKAKVQAKDAFREAVPARVQKIYSAVVAQYGDPSPDLTECFPHGRSVFSECVDGALNDHLGQLVTCLTPRVPPVAAAMLTDATAMQTSWTGLFAAAGTAKGNKKMMEAARRAAKVALADELFKNLLTYGLNFPDNLSKFAEFVPENLLNEPETPDAPGEATLNAGAWNSTTHLVTLTMQSDGATVFTLQRRLVGETTWVTVLDDIGADADGNGTFDDEIVAGNYEYRVIPRDGDGNEGEPSNVVTVNAA